MMRTARLVFAALSVTLACAGPRMPPPLPVAQQLAPPAIPETLPASDPTMLAVARVREPLGLAGKLGFPPDLLRLMLRGFTPSDVHPGALAGYLFEPAPERGEVPALLGLVPVKSDSSLAQLVQSRYPALQLEALGDDTLVAIEPSAMTRGLHQGPALRELAATPLQDDLQLHVFMKAVLARYGPALQRFVEQMQAAQATSKQPGDPAGMMKRMIEGLYKLDSVTIGGKVLPDAFAASLVLRDQSAPAPAPSAPLSPELVRYLPPGAVRMQGNGRWLQRFFEWMKNVGQSLGDPPLSAALLDYMKAWLGDAERMQMAFSFSIFEEKLWPLVQISSSSNAETLVEVTNTYVRLLGEPSLQESMKKIGQTCTSKVERGVRKIEGWPVDHAQIDCTPSGDGGPPAAAAMIRKAYPMTFEWVRLGGFVVFAVNSPSSELDRIAHELLEGKPTGEPLVAATVFPDDGYVRADLDLAKLVQGINGFLTLLPNMDGKAIPALDPSLAPVVLSAYETGALTQYRGQISKAAVNAIREIIASIKASASKATLPTQ